MVFCSVLSGCSQQSEPHLDKDDLHFAGFYTDYLLESGVAAGREDVAYSALETADINKLLARHALSRERLNRKIDMYEKNPEYWRLILVQVRANILKKTEAAK